MMGVDEQGRARAMPAQHFQQPAIGRLAQPAPAAFARQARPQHAEPTKPIDDRLRNHRLAIDCHGVDMLGQKLPQFGGHSLGLRIGAGGIRKQFVVQESAKEKPLGKARLGEPVAEHFLGLSDLLFALRVRHVIEFEREMGREPSILARRVSEGAHRPPPPLVYTSG